MAYTTTPIQTRYNDPYQQPIFEFNTDSKMYLSKESNRLLNVIGNDIVIKGMEMSDPTILSPSTVLVTIAPGCAIQDETLIEFTDVSSLDIDCSYLIDTPTSGAHLCVFLNYENIQTIEANLASVDLFYVEASGVVNDPFGRFKTRSCRILLGIIDFTKDGTSVTAVSKNDSTTLSIADTTYYAGGMNPDNINIDVERLFDVGFESKDRSKVEDLLKRDYVMFI